MWKTVKLGDACLVRRGTTITKKNAIEGDVPVIGGGTKPTYFHNEPNREASCITISGSGASAGFVNRWDLPIFASDCSTVEPKDKMQLPKFIYYYLLSQQQFIYDNFRSGAAQPHVYAKDIETLDFPILPLLEQERIVAKLDAAFADIDEAKESHMRKIQECGSLVNITISKILKKFTEQNSTSNSLGEVTYTAGRIGWKGLTKKEYVDQGYLFLSVHGLNYGKFVDFGDAFRITKERFEESPEIMLEQGDVLLCKDGAGIGKLAIVNELKEPATINSSLLLIRPNESLSSEYVYYYLLASEFQSIIQSKIDGATTPHLYQRDIRNLPIIFPEKSFQKQTVAEIEAAIIKIEEIRLSSLRNSINYAALKSAILAQELQSSEAA